MYQVRPSNGKRYERKKNCWFKSLGILLKKIATLCAGTFEKMVLWQFYAIFLVLKKWKKKEMEFKMALFWEHNIFRPNFYLCEKNVFFYVW